MARPEALKEIERLSGTQFDPRIVATLTSALEQLDAQDGPEAAASTTPSLADPGR
jgi:HD-GYP domain-containing protein (c-di-GMP phosphodiesterase class II)